jgi:riboflavin biosynthesis pyrimidine reductase
MGASTLRSFKKPCLASSGSKQPFNVILSSSLEKISPRWEFFSNQNIQRILFANEKTPADRIRIFSQSSQVILLKKPTRKNPIAIQILNHLENLGIRRLLIEGGGGVMWDFVKYNLIDEYHVTLTPRLLGGEQAPTLIDGEGFLPHQVLNLKLLKCRVVGNEIYLTYRKLAKNS